MRSQSFLARSLGSWSYVNSLYSKVSAFDVVVTVVMTSFCPGGRGQEILQSLRVMDHRRYLHSVPSGNPLSVGFLGFLGVAYPLQWLW